MRCAFIGCFLLATVNLSGSLHISQKPRFIGAKHHRSAPVVCEMQDRSTPVTAEWFKASEYHLEPRHRVVPNDRFRISRKDNVENGLMIVSNLQPDDSGVYFCKLNGTWGPGTGLQVFRNVNAELAVRRSRIKDAMIFIQALLLAAALISSLVLHLKQTKKEDAIYEEPDDYDHIYEGLDIEHSSLYEEIPAVCQSSAATWFNPKSPRGE